MNILIGRKNISGSEEETKKGEESSQGENQNESDAEMDCNNETNKVPTDGSETELGQ